jgi:type I restriction enzyme, S subunit
MTSADLTIKLQPRIRFKGFSDDWKKVSLSSVTKKVMIKNKDFSIKNVISNSARQGLVVQRDYFDKDIANSANINGYYVIEKGDFVYNPRISSESPYGPVNIYKFSEPGVVSPLYLCFKVIRVDNYFLSYFFKTSRWYRHIYTHGDQGARYDRVSIKDSAFFNLTLFVPSEKEQKKIAEFLSLLEQKIKNQSKKIDQLELFQKGMMQKIFSREIRFKDENGQKFPEWKQKPLNELVERITRKNKNLESTLPLTISAQHGLVDQVTFFNKAVASTNLEGYYLLYKGEFAYNKSYSNNYPFGAIKRLEKCEKGVLSSLYICFKKLGSISSDYLSHYFESTFWHKEVSMISVEGARNHGLLNISVSDFFDTLHFIPSLEEQQKIADYLSTHNSKLEKEREKLECLIKLKKGLMQKMFI